MKKILHTIFLSPVYFYRYALSPMLPHACRFSPSCSVYLIEAVYKHGIYKGILLGSKRLRRCHPWGPAGYDPVP